MRVAICLSVLLGMLVAASPGVAAKKMRDSDEDVMESWGRRMDQVASLLQDSKWRKSRKQIDAVMGEMCDWIEGGPGAGALLARATLLRALAAAGAEDRAEALWDYSMVSALEPVLAKLDLTSFGVSGERLAEWSAAITPPTKSPSGKSEPAPGVTPPRRKFTSRAPKFPAAKRYACTSEPVVVQMIIGKDGLPHSPELLTPAEPILGFAAMEAVRKWRFDPAKLEGKPVAVFYNLTVNFKSIFCVPDASGPLS